MYYNDFPTRLKIALNNSNMTQTQLANKTKLDKSLISNYLNGNYKPKEDKLNTIANALEVNPLWLKGYDVDMYSGDDLLDKKDSILFTHIITLSKSEIEKELLIKCTMLDEDNQSKVLELINLYLKEQGDYFTQDKNGKWIIGNSKE